MKGTLKEKITGEGQPYFDEPVYVKPKKITKMEHVFASLYQRKLPDVVKVGHTRIKLRWMKPDGRGGLIPK